MVKGVKGEDRGEGEGGREGKRERGREGKREGGRVDTRGVCEVSGEAMGGVLRSEEKEKVMIRMRVWTWLRVSSEVNGQRSKKEIRKGGRE